MNKNDLFIDICKTLSLNFSQDFEKYRFSNKCRYCGKIFDKKSKIVITQSYWGGLFYPCHEECKIKGEDIEKYECQCIDSDCNDCFYFERISQNSGMCLKYNSEVKSQSKFCTLNKCFKHRKDIK